MLLLRSTCPARNPGHVNRAQPAGSHSALIGAALHELPDISCVFKGGTVVVEGFQQFGGTVVVEALRHCGG